MRQRNIHGRAKPSFYLSPIPLPFSLVSVDHRKPELASLSPSLSFLFSFSSIFSLFPRLLHVPFSSVDHQASAEPDIPRVVPPYNPPPKSADLFMSVSISCGSSINLLRRRRVGVSQPTVYREGRIFARGPTEYQSQTNSFLRTWSRFVHRPGYKFPSALNHPDDFI